jgi:hypothetical protein
MNRRLCYLLVLAATSLVACRGNEITATSPSIAGLQQPSLDKLAGNAKKPGKPSVVTASCDITTAVADYRARLGTLNSNVVGEQPGGRREINWDAVPALNTNNNTFPANFFNQPVTGRARGVVFSTNGSGFRVSDNDFFDINPDYADEFNAFSPIRTFAAVESNRTDVQFFVAGGNTSALSSGFGVVFSDVDKKGSAQIKLIGANGHSLGDFQAPACPGGFSFVGVAFDTQVIARVEIKSGKGALGANSDDVSDRNHGPARDLVVMDDFIYGEPRALP